MKDFKKKQIGSLAVMAAVIAALGLGTGLSDLSGSGTATARATGDVMILTGDDAQEALALSTDTSEDAAGDAADFEARTEAELRDEVEELEETAYEAGSGYEGYIVKLADSSEMVSVLAEADTELETVGSKGVLYKADSLDTIFEEIDASEIEYIEPDYIVTLMEADTDTASFALTAEDETASADSFDDPNDYYYEDGSQWNLDVINAQSAWEYGLDGSSVSDGEKVVVAIIDSGINSTHEDIDASHIVEGYSYVTTDTSDTGDTLGHGTFVSGEVFAVKDNEVGIAGIMPEVYIMPLRVFGSSGSAYTSDIVSAIEYATESGEVDVISMSLGSSSSSSSMETACEEAIEAGILITASAGNDGDYTVNYPAAYDCVIGVGSTGTDDSHTEVSSFSSLGTSNVFCTAPGYKLTSTYYESDDSYYTGSGTSFSNPEVAALAAMVKSIDRSTTQDEFKQLIIDTSIDLGDAGRDAYYGYGLIDFGAVVEAMVDTTVTESTVTFNIVNEDGAAVDGASVTITKYDDETKTAIAASEDGTYTLEVGRYNYSVSAEKYQTASGTFAVITGSRTVTITLEGLTYPVYFNVLNTNGETLENASVTIKNAKGALQSPVEDDSSEYALKTGTYTYSVSATDYYTQTGTFTVGEGGGSVFVTLYGDIDVASAALNIINEDGDAVSGVTVTIYNEDGGEVEVYSDGYYKLYPGDYTWTATAVNYKDESGSFTITDEMKNTYISIDIPMLNPIVWVYFEVVPIDAQVAVYDSNGTEIEAYAAGEYKLEKGDYTYAITADGYETATGSFTITTSGKTLEIDLESSDAAENASVLFVSNGGTAVSSQIVALGEGIEQPEDPARTGYDFAGWYKESTLTTPWDFDTDVVTADTTLYAKWTAKTYNVIYMFGEEVLTDLEPSTHTYGTAVTELPEPVIEGCHFLYWCSDSALTEEADRISAYKASDAVLYAYAAEDTGIYTVSFESNGGSEVESVEASEETSYLVTQPDDPVREGYDFAGWYADEELTEAFDFASNTIDWHTTLYAKWAKKTYTITYYDGEEELTGLTPDTYTVGDSVLTLPSVTKTGYVFGGWYADSDLTVRVRNIAAGTTGDLVLYVKWNDTQTSIPEDDCDYEPDADGNFPETDDEGYTLIYTQEQLAAMTLNDESVKYRLAQSILLTGEWSPIGTSSSSYFAGTLDGAGHTIAGLYIKSTSQAQGLFGYCYGATIKNLKLYGSVQGAAYTGGLVGNAYSETLIKNVVSGVDVTCTGTSAGGIVGYLTNSTVTNCINYGDVTCTGSISTATCIRATGGIVGSTAAFSTSAVNSITYCANYGDVTSSVCTPTGGILGYASSSTNTIQYCYNMGDLTQTGTSYTTYGSVSGVVGYVQGSATTITSCYSAGAMSATKKCAGVAIYQSSAGVSNCFYLEGTAEYGLYKLSSSSSTPSAVSDVSGTAESFAYSDTWDYASLIESLGSTVYAADSDGSLNGGYPVLAKHYVTGATLTLEIVDHLTGEAIEDAVVTINGETVAASSLTVPVGMTDFTVSADGYDTESGRFYMGPENLVLTVELETESFAYSITVSPSDADFTLTNELLGTIEPESTETTDAGCVYTYRLSSSTVYGDYAYSASKYLYETASGDFTATGEGAFTVTLAEAAYNTVTFDITPSDAVLTLSLDGTVIEPYDGTVYHLEDGTYDYTIRCDGYTTYTASAAISGDKYISVVLEEYDGWDGSTTDDDWYDADADSYYISTAEEFAYFAQICTDGTTFSGKTVYLTADIDLNDQSWTPIGTYSSSGSSGFMGTFEGGGYSISGLNVSASSANRGGLFGFTSSATIRNLTVYGSVAAYNYSGGVAATARSSIFENVTSYVDVTASGYQIGGVVGQATNGGSFIRCRNYGTVTTTADKTGTNSYALGGVIGACTSGSASIEYCVNYGAVNGAVQSVGGVIGYAGATSGSVTPSLSYCYNAGSVTNGYESGYCGGVIGRFYGSYNTGSITGSVNTGDVNCDNESATGGIIGYDSGADITITNNYYYYASAALGVGGESDVTGCAESFGSEEDNGYAAVAEALSSAFTLNENGGLMLRWEDASQKYAVTFTAVYDTEANRATSSSRPVVTVTNGSEEFVVSSSGTVSLPNGTYTYTAGEQGYEDTTGTFVVSCLDREVTLDLTAVLYDLTITYAPKEAELTVVNAAGTALIADSGENGTAVYKVTNGSYTYSASCYGYTASSGTVNVSYGAADASISLVSTTTADVTFKVKAESGIFTDSPSVTIYQDGTKAASFTGTSGTVTLPVGTYTYIARASGYTTASAEFTVSEDTDTIEITLAAKEAGTITADTYWYYEDPDASEYTISTLEELYGLAELVNGGVDEFDGRTITMANDISMENSAWTPIGSYDGYRFMGTFDGGGHVLTISNGTMSGTEITFGLFGYLEDAAVTDLILRGSVSITHSSDSTSAVVVYAGSLAGYATGSTIERVSSQLNVTVEAGIGSAGVLDVGGLVGWVTNSTIKSCSNTGNVTAQLTTMAIGTNNAALVYAGGIAGFSSSMSSKPMTFASCYNIGVISAQADIAQAGGIIGALNSSNSSAVIKSCYNAGSITANDGSGTTGAFTGNSSVSGTTTNNYYLEGTAESGFGTCVTSQELMSEAVAAALGSDYEYVSGNYPKLIWEQTIAFVSVYTQPDKTAYEDMEDFDETGMELLATYADGSTEIITSGWTVLDGSDLRVNKEGETENSTETVNVNISYRGLKTSVPVTVTQVVHTIDASELSFAVPLPTAGETAKTLTIEEDKYTVTVNWTKDGEDFTGTFEENEFYRAEVTLDAYYVTGEVWYDFASNDAPDVDGALEVLYKQVRTVSENGGNRTRMTATVTFPATSELSGELTASAFHKYYKGDDNVSGSYTNLLDRTLTISVEDQSVTYTIEEIEEMALDGMGIEETYTVYNGVSRSNTVYTGISLYKLCKKTGLFKNSLSDDTIITIGEVSYTWGQIRTKGYSYDAEGNQTGSGLPALLAFGSGGSPLGTADGPLSVLLPMTASDAVNSGYVRNAVSDISVESPVYTDTCVVWFAVSSEDGKDLTDLVTITLTDDGKNEIEAEDGIYTLNIGSSYDYKITADGYGTQYGTTGTLTGTTVIPVKLVPVWDGETLTEPEYSGGYYLITTAEELMWYNANDDGSSNLRLMADIYLNSDGEYVNTWEPMNTSETNTGSFTAIFDGNGHTIYNLYIDYENEYELEEAYDGSPLLLSSRADVLGMFGYVSGVIKDLAVTGRIDVLDRPDSSLASWMQLGVLAGYLYQGGSIEGCYTDVDISYTVGTETTTTADYPDSGFPEYCDTYVGGIAGSVVKGTVSNCYTTGDISAVGTRTVNVGGITGGMRSSSAVVEYCYATGALSGAPSEIASNTFSSGIGSIAGSAVTTTSTSCGSIKYCFGLSSSIDLTLSDGLYGYANRVIGDDTSGAVTLAYNYGSAEMTFGGNAEHNNENFSKSSVNGGDITLARAKESLKPYTNVGWSATVWKSDSSTVLPSFIWQNLDVEVVTYAVTIEDPSGAAAVHFTGGVSEADDGSYTTTNTSTVTFTVDIGSGFTLEDVSVSGGILSTAGGYYTVSSISGPLTITIEPGVVYGDVDHNGAVNTKDAVLIRRYLAGVYEPDAYGLLAADVNDDGTVDDADAQLILQYAAGSLTGFPDRE